MCTLDLVILRSFKMQYLLLRANEGTNILASIGLVDFAKMLSFHELWLAHLQLTTVLEFSEYKMPIADRLDTFRFDLCYRTALEVILACRGSIV